MRLLFVNPNATASMTEKLAETARAVAAPDVEIIARTNLAGPPSIQGEADGEAARPGLLAEIAKGEAEGVDASIIACFDDTALAEARAAATRPVIGIGEAAFHAAVMLGERFAVVTSVAAAVPIIEANIRAYGFAGHCAAVRASGVPVLDLETAPETAADRVRDEAVRTARELRPDVLVLGCAGMTDLAARIARETGMPVVDGVAAACGLARSLAALNR